MRNSKNKKSNTGDLLNWDNNENETQLKLKSVQGYSFYPDTSYLYGKDSIIQKIYLKQPEYDLQSTNPKKMEDIKIEVCLVYY